jgi:hypothetical protein
LQKRQERGADIGGSIVSAIQASRASCFAWQSLPFDFKAPVKPPFSMPRPPASGDQPARLAERVCTVSAYLVRALGKVGVMIFGLP